MDLILKWVHIFWWYLAALYVLDRDHEIMRLKETQTALFCSPEDKTKRFNLQRPQLLHKEMHWLKIISISKPDNYYIHYKAQRETLYEHKRLPARFLSSEQCLDKASTHAEVSQCHRLHQNPGTAWPEPQPRHIPCLPWQLLLTAPSAKLTRVAVKAQPHRHPNNSRTPAGMHWCVCKKAPVPLLWQPLLGLSQELMARDKESCPGRAEHTPATPAAVTALCTSL